jgi:hypothetical protein
MVGQPVEQIGEIGFGLEIIELCGLCRLPNYAERLFRSWRYEALFQPFRPRSGR